MAFKITTFRFREITISDKISQPPLLCLAFALLLMLPALFGIEAWWIGEPDEQQLPPGHSILLAVQFAVGAAIALECALSLYRKRIRIVLPVLITAAFGYCVCAIIYLCFSLRMQTFRDPIALLYPAAICLALAIWTWKQYIKFKPTKRSADSPLD